MDNYFMGIDLGTSSVKSVILNEQGMEISSAGKSYDIIKKRQDYAEQNMELLWEATKEVICEVVKRIENTEAIRGIGFSGQMHGLVLLDKEEKLIRHAIIWADQRSFCTIEHIYKCVPAAEYNSIVGNALSTGFFASSLMWVRENEAENYSKIKKAILPKDYIRYKLCGEIGTDISDASSTAIFDINKRDWAWNLIDKLEIDRDIFPECRESYKLAGNITGRANKETGLPTGIPVFLGGGDALMQSLGNGAILPGSLTANIGTASQVCCTLEKALVDPLFRTNTFCHVHENLWNIQGSNLSGGIGLKWLMNNILKFPNYEAMTELAVTTPAGSEGLLFLPYLSGERTPYNDPNAKAIFLGLTLKHSKAHMIRSVMEGIVFSMKNSLEIFDALGIEYGRVVASGGGARGRLFLQLLADILEKEVYTSVSGEQAGVGAAITAAVGSEYYMNHKEACRRMVKYSTEVIEPDTNNLNIYREQYERYRCIYPQNKKLF